jgi:hypothetical protein
MRISAAVLIAIFLFVSVSCGPVLQPAVQGEWSSVHSDKDKVSDDARPDAEKPAAER